MNKSIVFAVAATAAWLASPARADIIFPSAVLTSQADGADFDTTIALTNVSTSQSGIGTFWFAWIPGQDYLATRPLELFTPTGWKATITGGTPGDGFAIQWVALTTAADIAPGGTLDFGFKSVDTPAEIAGNSQFFPQTPVETAFVYPGAPFSDAGHRFLVRSVPEPSSLMLVAGGLATVAASRRRRRRDARIAIGA